MGAGSFLWRFKNTLKGLFSGGRKIADMSYSRIKAYRFCPLKYKLIYELQWKEKLNPQSSLGLSLHRALEQFHKNKSATVDSLAGYLDQYWVNDGFASAEDSYEAYDYARGILNRYFEQWQKEKSEVLYVEKEFAFFIENFRVQGIIDRIDKTPDGLYEVIDYKTRVRPQDRNSDDLSIQLGIYYIACEKILGRPPQKLYFYCLTSGDKITKKFDGSDRKDLINLIKETGERIKKMDFAPDLAKCGKCDFNGRCPKK